MSKDKRNSKAVWLKYLFIMFNIQVAFNIDINCLPTQHTPHNTHSHKAQFVCTAKSGICLFGWSVLALSLIWKENNNNNEDFSDFCWLVVFRGDFLKQLGHPRINVIMRICPRTCAEYRIIPLVDKNISVNTRSLEVQHENKYNLSANTLRAEHCHLQGQWVVTTALFQCILCCSHGDRYAKNFNSWDGTFTDFAYQIYDPNILPLAAG